MRSAHLLVLISVLVSTIMPAPIAVISRRTKIAISSAIPLSECRSRFIEI